MKRGPEPDYYTRRAKDLGYPARSVFKLQELQQRFGLISRGNLVLDIGSAPGSWSLYVVKELKARVVGVDLTETALGGRVGPDFTFVLGDIFDQAVATRISELGPYHVVLSDAAPSTGGSRLVDSAKSGEIAERVLALALSCLKTGGNLVIKILQGSSEREILQTMRRDFGSARALKPKACRKGSTEIYLVGIEYLKKVLDGRYVDGHNAL